MAKAVKDATNDAKGIIESGKPFRVSVTICGVADILMHRWSTEAVAAKSDAKKGSAAKKTDDLESYAYRDHDGYLSIPGDALKGAIAMAAKSFSDPRSPRKSAMDLVKASIVIETRMARILSAKSNESVKAWDYEDARRVRIQQNAVTRTRPAMTVGWKATFTILVLAPQYVDAAMLKELIDNAGQFVGVLDHRPTYGRFTVVSFETI